MPHELSGGEQQRIVLARALLNAPPLILADEPTGNIDPETSYRLVELLKDICDNGTTVIIATHQYDLLEKYPGKVLRCDNGTLTEDSELSAPPHSLAPEVIESIENIPLEESKPTENELPSVLESDILTPVETKQPNTFVPKEDEVIATTETVVSETAPSAEVEEKTESVEEIVPKAVEGSVSEKDPEEKQEVKETTKEQEIPEIIPMNDEVIASIESEEQTTIVEEESPASAQEEEEEKKPKAETPFGFELIE